MIWDRVTPPAEALLGIPLPEGGYRLRPYFDGFRTWSIGAGSTRMPDGSPVTAHSRAISLAEAHALFAAELAPCCRALAEGTDVPLLTGLAGGTISWLFNCGVGHLAGSRIRAMIEASEADRAMLQLAVWCEARDEHTHVLEPDLGLMRRRRFEGLLAAGAAPADAYYDAWKLTYADGMARYHQALADAAAWDAAHGHVGALARPLRAPEVTHQPAGRAEAPKVPRAEARGMVPEGAASAGPTTASLNDASAAGILSFPLGD